MKCECGFWDRDRPHSRVGGGVCEYAFRRKYAVDNTGDIAIPDEVVDLKLLLECRHERNVLQKICAERSDEIDRLRAENEAHHWRPIDTAPQDGSLLLLGWWRTWPQVEFEREVKAAGNMDTGRPGTRWRHGQATHWMPLPKPPALRGEGE